MRSEENTFKYKVTNRLLVISSLTCISKTEVYIDGGIIIGGVGRLYFCQVPDLVLFCDNLQTGDSS